jgi:hypothetical protein
MYLIHFGVFCLFNDAIADYIIILRYYPGKCLERTRKIAINFIVECLRPDRDRKLEPLVTRQKSCRLNQFNFKFFSFISNLD